MTLRTEEIGGIKPWLDVGIVIVNYKAIMEAVNYISNQLSRVQLQKAIIIINNQAIPDVDNEIAEKHGVRVMVSASEQLQVGCSYLFNVNDNIGCARGNNLGALLLMNSFRVPYILFSNTDIKFVDDDVVEKLIAKLNEDRSIGAIGPRVLNSEGKEQSPRYDRIGPLRYALWHIFHPIRSSHILSIFMMTPGKREIVKRHTAREGVCYWVSGCFFIVRTSAFFEVGLFDEGTFLYSEEKILSERLSALGKVMYYCPVAAILHLDRGVQRGSFDNFRKKKLIFESDLFYYQNYVKISPFQIGLLKVSRWVYLNLYHFRASRRDTTL